MEKVPRISLRQVKSMATSVKSVKSVQHKPEKSTGQKTQDISSLNSMQRPGNVQASLEILKNLNFQFNPNLNKKKPEKKQAQQQQSVFSSSKSYVDGSLLPSAVTRNILEFRGRSKQKNMYLMEKPKLNSTNSFKKGSLSILKNSSQTRGYIVEKYACFIKSDKSTLGEKGKEKLRLQVVKWLQEHKLDVVEIICFNKQNIIDWIKYVNGVNIEEFILITDHIGIQKDRNLLNRLFWLFDLNQDQKIDSEEIMYGINFFVEETLEEKINRIFELCDENEDGIIKVDELKRFFVKNLQTDQEKRQAKFLSADFVEAVGGEGAIKTGFRKEDLYNAAIQFSSVRVIIEKNTRILKSNKGDDQLTPLHSLIPAQDIDNQNSSFFPYMDKMMSMMSQKQQIYESYMDKGGKLKIKSKKSLQDSSDSDDEDSDE